MRIAVYCSAKDAIPEEYLTLGDALGAWLGAQGHTMKVDFVNDGPVTIVLDSAEL